MENTAPPCPRAAAAVRGTGRRPGAGIVTPGKTTVKGGACGAVTRDSLRSPWTAFFPGMTLAPVGDEGQERTITGCGRRPR